MSRPPSPYPLRDIPHRLPLVHDLEPLLIRRKFLQALESSPLLQKPIRIASPRDEREIGIGALVSHQPAGLEHRCVENADDALDLVHVPVDGGRELFGVEAREPCGLAEVWTLSCGGLLESRGSGWWKEGGWGVVRASVIPETWKISHWMAWYF